MSWFNRLLGKDEEEQAVVAAPQVKAPPAPSPAFAEDETGSARNAGGKKVKLNFKKIPKQVVAAIAAETTAQPAQQQGDGRDRGARAGGLSDIFNDAASPSPKPKMPMRKAPTL